MTHEKRVVSLQAFEYTGREADFLCLAALHRGYFLRRQYCNFLGQSPGRVDGPLVAKVLALRPCTEEIIGRGTFLYHLCSRAFYKSIFICDNRRRRLPLAIKAKFTAFNFVLANPGHRHLATQHEMTAYFTGEAWVRLGALPSKPYRLKQIIQLIRPCNVSLKPVSCPTTTTFLDMRKERKVALGAPHGPKIDAHLIFGRCYGTTFGPDYSLNPSAPTGSLPHRGQAATDQRSAVRAGATPGFGSVARPKPSSVAAATPGVAPARTSMPQSIVSASSRACVRACIRDDSRQSSSIPSKASSLEALCP